jgi:hypothetical protein
MRRAAPRVIVVTMTTTSEARTIEPAMAERLSARFHDVFTTFEAGDDAFTPDVFCDLNMPEWRFQLQGRDAFAAQLARINQGPARMEVLRTVPTTSGFVTEHVEHQDVDGEDRSARRLVLCEVVRGRIAEVTVYCTGEWDDELRARHAAEAPMIRS